MFLPPNCLWPFSIPFFLLSFLAILTPLISANARIKVPEVHHLKGYQSPLDKGMRGRDIPIPEDMAQYYGDAEDVPPLMDEDFPEEGAEGGLLSAGGGAGTGAAGAGLGALGLGGLAEAPLCQQECLSKFSGAVKAAMQSSSNVDRFKGVYYNNTIGCMDQLEGEKCSNQETFHVFTSGVRYMCIEQRKAFNAVIECIDAQSTEVEKECEDVCHVKERMTHWALKSGIMDNLMQGALSSLANGENFAAQIFGRGAGGLDNLMGLQQHRAEMGAMGQKRGGGQSRGEDKLLQGVALQRPQGVPLSKRITPEFMRSVVQDGCELTRCQLICIRVKFDAKCQGSAGTLLSEAFVRPISQAQEFLTYGHVAPFMGAFLPHQCDFMVKKEVLNEFRIPPELDDALHRKFDQSAATGGAGEAAGGDDQQIEGPQGTGNGTTTEKAPQEKQKEGSSPSPADLPKEPKRSGVIMEEEKKPAKGKGKKTTMEEAGGEKEEEEEEEGLKFDGPMELLAEDGKGKEEEEKGGGVGPGDRTKVSNVVGKTVPSSGGKRRGE